MHTARRANRDYDDRRGEGLTLPVPQAEAPYRPYLPSRRARRGGPGRGRVEERPVPTPSSLLRAALDRIMLHWTLAYLAAAWLVLQLMDVLAEIWAIPLTTQRFVCLALGLGLFPALVIAWFHGERGRQRVCGLEAALVGALLFGAGVVLWTVFAG